VFDPQSILRLLGAMLAPALLGVTGVASADAQTLVSYGFEDGPAGWLSLDPQSGLQVTYTPEEVRSGQGDAEADVQGPDRCAQWYSVSHLSVPGARSLQFWLRTAAPSASRRASRSATAPTT
jgi:hypothetical protein